MLHLNCTALSQSESSNFFMYIIIVVIVMMQQLQLLLYTIEIASMRKISLPKWGGIWRCLKRERDIGTKAKLSDIKTAFS